MRNFFIFLALVGFGYYGYTDLFSDSVENGVYVNHRYNFTIDIPSGWTVKKEKELSDAGYSAAGPQDNRLFAVKDTIEQGLFSIMLMDMPISFQQLTEEDTKASFVNMYKSNGFDIRSDETYTINGAEVIHLKTVYNEKYIDLVYFGNEDVIIQTSFEFSEPIDHSTRQDIKTVVESITMHN